jgi:hypothetical protein
MYGIDRGYRFSFAELHSDELGWVEFIGIAVRCFWSSGMIKTHWSGLETKEKNFFSRPKKDTSLQHINGVCKIGCKAQAITERVR